MNVFQKPKKESRKEVKRTYLWCHSGMPDIIMVQHGDGQTCNDNMICSENCMQGLVSSGSGESYVYSKQYSADIKSYMKS